MCQERRRLGWIMALVAVAAVGWTLPAVAGPITTFEIVSGHVEVPTAFTDSFGTITIEALDGNSATVLVEINESAFEEAWGLPEEPNNFGMDKFGFRTTGISGLSLSNISPAWRFPAPGNGALNGYGKLDWVLAGRGNSRTSTLSFDITTTTTFQSAQELLDALFTSDVGVPFAAHIGGFGPDGELSGYFSVPEPSTLLLFGASLSGAGLMLRNRRRRREKPAS